MDITPNIGVSDSDTLLARLNRLPTLKLHYVWVALLAIHQALEFYSNTIFAYAAAIIQANSSLNTEQIGMIIGIVFIGMIIGSAIGGKLSDMFGRRTVIIWATILYSVSSLVTAYAQSYEVILLSRLVTGIGLQAANSVVYVYVAEMFPSQTRGRFMAITTFGFFIGTMSAIAIPTFYLPTAGLDGWRHAFYIGWIGFILVVLTRLYLPESIRWLVDKHKFHAADNHLHTLEQKALTKGRLPALEIVKTENIVDESFTQLLKNPKMLKLVAVVSLGLFTSTLGYFLYGNWITYSLVYGLHYTEAKAYNIAFYWGLIYGLTPIFSAYILNSRFERKNMIMINSIICAVPLVIIGISSSDWAIGISGAVMAIASGVIFNLYFLYIPEMLPTSLRASGSGAMIGFGYTGGAISGALGAWLFDQGGIESIMIIAAACYLIFAIPILIFGPRNADLSIE